MIQTFGSVQVVETPGFKFKIPYLQRVSKVSKASKQFSVGYDILTNESIHKESFMITSDYNFVNVDFYFEYQITDPVKYFYAAEEPERPLLPSEAGAKRVRAFWKTLRSQST